MNEGLFTLLRIAPEQDDPTSTYTKAGAERLKQKIEAYWAERGEDVHVEIRPREFHPSIRSARFDVVSDLVNGLPRNLVYANRSAA